MIPNMNYQFRIDLNIQKFIRVFVDPDELESCNIDFHKDEDESYVADKYFTQEKIDKIKKEFIKRIEEIDNPFTINCVDVDSDYNITDKQIFKLKN